MTWIWTQNERLSMAALGSRTKENLGAELCHRIDRLFGTYGNWCSEMPRWNFRVISLERWMREGDT